jgi:UDPglucose 6-dehydrogenase
MAAAAGADLIVLGTEWDEYRALDPASLASTVNGRTIIDARNALDPAAWRGAGWTYRALGRPHA